MAAPALDPLIEFLRDSNGHETLTFETAAKATEAARLMRLRHPGVSIEARFEKVFIKVREHA
jgi:hypothetical protein